MSTRATIIFIGANEYDGSGTKAVRLYQHCDGYPTNVLPTLLATLRVVRKKMEDHYKHISYKRPGSAFDFLTVPINVETLAGCYIAEETTGFGMGAHVEKSVFLTTDVLTSWDADTRVNVFGHQEDLEWIYVVNALDRSIKVFGGGYTGDPAVFRVEAGTVDIMDYVNVLEDDYKEREGKTIKSAARSLGRIGFPINPKRQSGRRAAHEAQRARLRK